MRQKSIALIGGGPAALFMYKRLVEESDVEMITIFEKGSLLGVGMPYGKNGASWEHITNVSGNEIPEMVTPLQDWLENEGREHAKTFNVDPARFSDYKVLPRLLFGQYMSAQFSLLQKLAQRKKIKTVVHMHTEIADVKDDSAHDCVICSLSSGENHSYDVVVLCTGHRWPKSHEGKVAHWFDSPYPPEKLNANTAFPVAIRGASLTAIDAVRTIAKAAGSFSKNEDHTLTYTLEEKNSSFKIVLHSLSGLLPAVRFHLEDTHLTPANPLSENEIFEIKAENNGFVPLDLIFERNFLAPLKEKDPPFYAEISAMNLEGFVEHMMSKREKMDAFNLLKAEYKEAEKSIKTHQSVQWKETLGALSFAINQPAKHLSAEDMLRLRKTLMPLVAIVIAYVPQESCRELMALHEAGLLTMQSVNAESHVEPIAEGGAVYYFADEEGAERKERYATFIDARGQPPISFKDFPFESLKNERTVSSAYLNFADDNAGEKLMAEGDKKVRKKSSGGYEMQVPGIQINDYFQVLNSYGVSNPRLYVMAVPLIAGINPDYSGLDFCEAASAKIIERLTGRP